MRQDDTTAEPETGTATHRTADRGERERQEARQTYQQSVAVGMPLTGKSLGAMFSRGERWGRDRIAECRHAATDGGTVAARHDGDPAVPRTERVAQQTLAATAQPARGTAAVAARETATLSVPLGTPGPGAPAGVETLDAMPGVEASPATRRPAVAPESGTDRAGIPARMPQNGMDDGHRLDLPAMASDGGPPALPAAAFDTARPPTAPFVPLTQRSDTASTKHAVDGTAETLGGFKPDAARWVMPLPLPTRHSAPGGTDAASRHGIAPPAKDASLTSMPEQPDNGMTKVPRWAHGVAVALVVAACASALYFSGWGMWHFIDHKLSVDGWHRILPMFLLFDLAGIASAWLARIRRIEEGKTGVAGVLVWVFAVLSGLMSATDATTWGGQATRFAAPLVAAVMFELLISGERRAAMGDDNGTLARLVRRVKARFGLLDTLDQNDRDAARAAVAGRVAVLAYKVHQFDTESRARKRAVKKYHRRLRSATERFGFGGDAAMVAAVRLHLATLYRSLTDTTEEAVADINPWQSAVHEQR